MEDEIVSTKKKHEIFIKGESVIWRNPKNQKSTNKRHFEKHGKGPFIVMETIKIPDKITDFDTELTGPEVAEHSQWLHVAYEGKVLSYADGSPAEFSGYWFKKL